MLSLPRAQVQSLVGGLKSCKPGSAAKRTKDALEVMCLSFYIKTVRHEQQGWPSLANRMHAISKPHPRHTQEISQVGYKITTAVFPTPAHGPYAHSEYKLTHRTSSSNLAAVAAKLLQSCSTLCNPHRWQPTRLPHPWDSLGKNTGVGCHFPLQCMKVKVEVAQLCSTLRDPMDCSLPRCS